MLVALTQYIPPHPHSSKVQMGISNHLITRLLHGFFLLSYKFTMEEGESIEAGCFHGTGLWICLTSTHIPLCRITQESYSALARLGSAIHLYAQQEAETSLVMTNPEPLPHFVLPSFLSLTPYPHVSEVVILFLLSVGHNNYNNGTLYFSLAIILNSYKPLK